MARKMTNRGEDVYKKVSMKVNKFPSGKVFTNSDVESNDMKSYEINNAMQKLMREGTIERVTEVKKPNTRGRKSVVWMVS